MTHRVTIEIDLSLEQIFMLLGGALAAQRAGARPTAEPAAAPEIEPERRAEPAAAPVARFRDDWVTEERSAAVRAQFALGPCRYARLSDVLNALPGLPVDPETVRNWAVRERIRPVLTARQAAHAADAVARMKKTNESKTAKATEAAPPIGPPQTAAPQPQGDWLTPDRRAELRRRIEDGQTPGVYCSPLRAMPGPPIPDNRKVQARAIALGIRYVPPPKPTAAPLPAAGPGRLAAALTLPKEPVDTTTPIVTDLQSIRIRAATWGIEVRGPADLAAVNAKAKAIGHRPFAIEPVVPRRQA